MVDIYTNLVYHENVSNGTYTYNYSNLSHGTHYWNVTVFDGMNYTSNLSEFFIDLQPPYI